LVVEDEAPLAQAYARVLEQENYDVRVAYDGLQALELWNGGEYDVVISDVRMPGMDGVNLLRVLRQRGLDVPVILITAEPDVDSAVSAVEYGALRYLSKPVGMPELLETVRTASKLSQMTKLRREAALMLGEGAPVGGGSQDLDATLERALGSLWMAYQPILDANDHSTRAFEALVRTSEPAIPHPGALFSAAEQLGRVHHVGQRIRAAVAAVMGQGVPCNDVFVNLHPADIFDDDLYDANSALAPFAERVVLEVTERAALEGGTGVTDRVRDLRALGYRIAVDDLGAGYAGLNYLAMLEPDVVKLDIGLVRDIHKIPVKRKLVGSMIGLCRDLGIVVVAEGVETVEERDVLVELQCDLLQGFLFARPGKPFPESVWEGAL
jgi:EAL domain-containing protein (putative c-di-GMP-specific phosphodiesterase class I)